LGAGRAAGCVANLAVLMDVRIPRAEPLVIVGAAIVLDGRVLGCERAAPPETAGRWEFPGGKVEPGEDEFDALLRECEEELGVRIAIGERLAGDVPVAHGWAILRVWLATLLPDSPEPQALEHRSLRWLAVDELDSVPWLPADAPLVAELGKLLDKS
jgi:8-oxo-dGTP diphosphatase